jgi:hypothetical protein
LFQRAGNAQKEIRRLAAQIENMGDPDKLKTEIVFSKTVFIYLLLD